MRNPEATTYIYVLRDPDTNAVRYVGKSVWPESRLYSHKFSIGLDKNPRLLWFKAMAEQGKSPAMEIVETTTRRESKAAEIRWIKHYLDEGCDLVNINYNPKIYNTYWKNQTRNITI